MLVKVFGFDRYSDITREYAIRRAFCDLAIKIGDKIQYLIEVKAMRSKLNDSHIKQAVDYGAAKGILWVVLTNGIDWILYTISFKQRVEREEVIRFSFIDLNLRNRKDLEKVFVLCKKGISKKLMHDVYKHKKTVNSSVLVKVLLSKETLLSIRKQLKRIGNGAKANDKELISIFKNEVIKRDLIKARQL